MSTDDRQVGVELTANNQQYDQSMAASTVQTEQLNKQVDGLGAKLDGLAKRAGRKLQIFGAVDVAGITATSYAAARFEKQMSGLQSQAAALDKSMGSGAKQFGKYKDAVNDMRKEFPVATDEAAGLVKTISGLSDNAEPIQKLAGSFTKLAGATGESSQELAHGVLSLGRQMGSSTKDVNDYNNTILKLSANSGQSAGSLLQFAQTLSPAGRQLKMSEKDILGISSAFGKAGQDGTLAANAFSTMANNISYAAQSGSPDLKQYADLIGVTQEQFKSMDSSTAFADMFDALNKQGSDAINTLNRFGLDGQRTMRGLQAVSQQGGIRNSIKEANDGMNEHGKTLQESSQAAFGGLGDQTKKLRNSMAMNAETFGAPFAKIATKFVEGMTQMSKAAGVVINGPLGKLAQLAAGIVAPMALLAGTLLTVAKGLSAVAGVRFLMGSGVGGLAGATGIGGRFTKKLATKTAKEYEEGDLNPFQERMFLGGQSAGNRINRARDASKLRGVNRLMGKGYTQSAAEASMLNRPGLVNRAGGYAAQSVGVAAKMGSDMYSPAFGGPASMGLDGMNSPGQRARMFKTANEKAAAGTIPLRQRMAGLRGDFQTGKADAVGYGAEKVVSKLGVEGPRMPGGEYFSTMNQRNMSKIPTADLRAGAQMSQATINTAKEFTSMGQKVRVASVNVGKFGGALGLAASGAGQTVGKAGGAVGSKLGSAFMSNPIMLGILGFTAGNMIYNKFKDKDGTTASKDYKSFLDDYATKSGVSTAGRIYSPKDRIDELRSKQQTGSMADALAIDPVSQEIANSPGYKLTQKRLKNVGNIQGAVQRLAPTLSTMSDIPETMISDIKTDLIKQFGGPNAKKVLDQLQTSDVNGVNGGNISARVKFKPEEFFKDKYNRPVEGKKAMGNAFLEQDEAIKSRASAALRMTGSQKAYTDSVKEDTKKAFGKNVFGKGGMWDDQGGPLDRLKHGFGGGQSRFIESFNDTYHANLDKSNLFLHAKSKDESFRHILEIALKDKDSDLGTFTSQAGITDPGNKKGKAREKAVKKAMAEWDKKSKPKDFTDLTPDALTKRKNSITSATGDDQIAELIYGKGGKGGTKSLQAAVGHEGNTSLQYDAILDTTKKLKGTSTDSIKDVLAANEKLRHAAQAAPAGAAQNLLKGAEGLTSQNMQIQMSRMDPASRAKASRANYDSLLADRPEKVAGETKKETELRTNEWAGKVTAAHADVEQQKSAAFDMVKQLTIQQENFDIQMKQGLEDFNTTRARAQQSFGIQQAHAQESYSIQRKRAYENFDIQRKRAEENFEKQRKRATQDYNRQVSQSNADFNKQRRRSITANALQEKYSRDDFNLQRKYGEEDFQHQVVMMTKQTAKSIYDIYKRVDVQRTVSSRNLLQNSADQLERMTKQEANLKKLRSMGMSKDSIQQLGLNDSGNAQQLDRLVGEAQDDPKIIKEFNAQVKKRLSAAKKLVTDDSSDTWTEMVRQHELSLKRSQAAFDKNLARSRTAFKLSMKHQDTDYATQMNRQEAGFDRSMNRQSADFGLAMKNQSTDFGRSMNQMAADFARSTAWATQQFGISMDQMATDFDKTRARAKKSMDKANSDLFRSGEQMLKTSGKNLGKAAKRIKKEIIDSLDGINTDGTKKIKKIQSDWSVLTGGSPFAGATKRRSGQGKKFVGRYASGGAVAGYGNGTSDQIDAKLSNNEHVLTAKNVEGMGGHSKVEEMRKAADRGQFHTQYAQRYARGGKVVMPIRGASAASLNTGYPGHTGVDFPVSMGTPVYSVADGTAYPMSLRGKGQGRGPSGYRSYGIYYKVSHPQMHMSSLYAHLSKHGKGQGHVKAGDFLGWSGSSGNSTGPHMHFEIPGRGAAGTLKFLRSIGRGGHYGSSLGYKGFIGDSIFGEDQGVTLNLMKKYKDLEKKAEDFPAFGGFKSGFMSNALNKSIKHWVKTQAKKKGIDYNIEYGNGLSISGDMDGGGGANSKGAAMGSKALQAVVKRALGMAGLPTSGNYVNAWVKQAMTESGGNPAIRQQIIDVNSFNGSGGAKGLMQTIPPTFNSYKMKGHGNIFNALDNSIAAMRYAESRYGRKGMLGVVGHGHGYSEGTEHAKAGWGMVGENGPELMHFKGGEKVWNKRQVAMATQINDGAGRRNNAVGSQPIVNNNYSSTKIDKSTTFTGNISVSASDPDRFLKQMQQQQRQQALTNPTMAGAR